MRHLKRDELNGASARGPAGVTALPGGGVTAETLDNAQAIHELREEWQALEALCPDTVFFQSFAWCRNYIDFAATDAAFAPRVIVLRANGRLAGLLPLALQTKGRMRILTGLTEPFQQYTDMLADPCIDALALREPLVAALRSTGADIVHLGQVRADSALACVAGDAIPGAGETDAAPCVSISSHRDYEAYLKTVKVKTRKNLRNLRNRLERDAPVGHAVSRDGEALRSVIERAYEGREAWLEELGITSRAFQDTDFGAFLARIAWKHGSATDLDVIAFSLRHGDDVLSDQWGFVWRGRYYAFMANWNPAYEAFSPGRLHLGEVIRTCFDEGLETADFLIPASSYKLSWTDDAVMVRDRVLPLTLRGWIRARLWLDILRPRAKAMFYRLPQGMRQALISLIGSGT